MDSTPKPAIWVAMRRNNHFSCTVWKLSMYLRMRLAPMAWCSSNSMWITLSCSIFAMGWVVISLVWKHLATLARFWNIHCTSTIMASQAPVTITSSCFWKLPAGGTLALKNLIGRTADAAQLNALSTF